MTSLSHHDSDSRDASRLICLRPVIEYWQVSMEVSSVSPSNSKSLTEGPRGFMKPERGGGRNRTAVARGRRWMPARNVSTIKMEVGLAPSRSIDASFAGEWVPEHLTSR